MPRSWRPGSMRWAGRRGSTRRSTSLPTSFAATRKHEPLIERAEALRDTVAEQIAAGHVDINPLRRDAGRLQSDFRQHIAAGVELTYEAYDRDMGGEG